MSGIIQSRLVVRRRHIRGLHRLLFLAAVAASFGTTVVRGGEAMPAPSAAEPPAIVDHGAAGGIGPQVGLGDAIGSLDLAQLFRKLRRSADAALIWYLRTPPGDRVAWGGLTVAGLLGLSILVERLVRLRERTIIPGDFTAKFLDRLHGGKLDAGTALDYCEENPSPAARVALAAVRRWGRPAADLERAVALAHRVETDGLNRNVGTLRRIAALAPLVGFLGTLFAAGRTLAALPAEASIADGLHAAAPVGPELAGALAPLTTGIVLATLAIVAYDGLMARVERLIGDLDRLGAETIDAIAMAAPCAASPLSVPASRSNEAGDEGAAGPLRNQRGRSRTDAPRGGVLGLVRSPRSAGGSSGRPRGAAAPDRR